MGLVTSMLFVQSPKRQKCNNQQDVINNIPYVFYAPVRLAETSHVPCTFNAIQGLLILIKYTHFRLHVRVRARRSVRYNLLVSVVLTYASTRAVHRTDFVYCAVRNGRKLDLEFRTQWTGVVQQFCMKHRQNGQNQFFNECQFDAIVLRVGAFV